MSGTQVDVVVVGAGPGGSVAAAMLALRGHSVLVLERATPAELLVGTGILLQPNGLAVLYGLGLESGLREISVVHRSVPVYDHRSRPIMTGELPDFGHGLDHALALLRGDLQEQLWELLDRSGAQLRFGSSVERVDPASGSVVVRSETELEEVTAELIVGADGIGSCVRRSGAIGAKVSGAHKVFRAVVDADCGLDGAEYWTPLGLFGGSPVGRGRTYVYGSADAPPVHDAIVQRDPAALAAVWSEVLPVAGDALRDVVSADQVLLNEVGRVRCRTFLDRRTVLIGDAAHSMAPNLGQGANSAFVDAATLALEVGRLGLNDGPVAYDRLRRRPVRRVQRNADHLAAVSHLRNPVLRRARDTIVRVAARPALVRRQIAATQQIDPAALLRQLRA